MESAPTDRIKLHLHRVEVGSGAYSALVPRPSSPYRFITEVHNDTVSVSSDAAGAGFLSRLVWATAYQSRARTLVLVDGDPFPIVIVNTELGVPTAEDCEELRAQLPLDGAAPGSVRLVTHGLDRALADPKRYLEEWKVETEGLGSRHRHRFTEVGGLLLFAAPPPVLRRWAFDGARMVAGLGADGADAGERTDSAELHVVPDLRAGDGARRVLWQAPPDVAAEAPGA